MDLSGDVLQHCMSFISPSIHLTKVCKTWRDHVHKCTSRLRFNDAAPVKEILEIVKNYPNLTELAILHTSVNIETILAICGYCPSLKKLDMSFCQNISQEEFEEHMPKQLEVKCDGCFRLWKPSPDLAPKQVVELQILALLHQDVAKCFQFASPENQEHTGPLERFTQMIQSHYSIMLKAEGYVIHSCDGTENKRFIVLYYHGNPVRTLSFLWTVRKQDSGEFENCFMTDAVTFCGLF